MQSWTDMDEKTRAEVIKIRKQMEILAVECLEKNLPLSSNPEILELSRQLDELIYPSES